MSNINVVGWYNHGNCGDESYKLSFPKLFPNHKFCFSESPQNNYDYYILGGGDIVCKNFIDKFNSIKNKSILSATVSNNACDIKDFNYVFLRDKQSLKNVVRDDATYTPDFAFALDYNVNDGKLLIEKFFKNKDLYKNVVSIIINSHLIPNRNSDIYHFIAFQNFIFELSNAIDNIPASFLFIPFSVQMPWDDRAANSLVASNCKFWEKNSVIYDLISVQDTINIISASDAVVSTRLHSSIFSVVTSTPFLDITHNHKNLWFLDTLGLKKYSIKYNEVSSSTINKNILEIIKSSQVKNELLKVYTEQKNILKEHSCKIDGVFNVCVNKQK